MAATKQRKVNTFITYIDILKFIYVCNKVVLVSQLEEVCIKYNLVRNKTHFQKAKKELIEGEMIRVERYTEGNVVILKKAPIAFLEGKNTSEQVAGVSSKIVQNRVKLTTLKIKFALFNTKTVDFISFLNEFEKKFKYNKNEYKAISQRFVHFLREPYKRNWIDKLEAKKEKERYKLKAVEQQRKMLLQDVDVVENRDGDMNYQISNKCYCYNTNIIENKLVFEFIIFIVSERANETKIGEVIAKTYDYYNMLKFNIPRNDEKTEYFKFEYKFFLVGNAKNLENICTKKSRFQGFTIIENAVAKTKKINANVAGTIRDESLEINYLKM